ncbi:MAG: glycoside hydrolase family 44 protein, partial [Actinomycetota bacterium]
MLVVGCILMKLFDAPHRRSLARATPARLRFLLPMWALGLAGGALVGGDLQAQTASISVAISVDASADRHPINPEIYGVAHASGSVLTELNAPLNREGGNNTSRYNWQQNADNRGNDWYYQSIPENSAVSGERGDRFIQTSQTAGAQAMLTIPTIGWVAKVGPSRQKLASFSIAKYGAQTGSDWQWFPDAGNGILASTGQPVQGNDPHDANVPADAAFQQNWVNHLVNKWGTGANGGLRYFILDNEPSIWHATHRDVHPVGATMDEVRDKMIDYATRIKAVDASAQVVGPEEWGWAGYLYSGYDQQYGAKNGWGYLPDRAAHGGQAYLPWLLDQLRREQVRTGQRLLDVFTVHYYPQGGEFSENVSQTMQLRRNRSTRSLWDPNYVDETWINDRVQLIPRMKGWVDSHYPGTRIGVTEYNWGAESHINGATTQADLYGIFGREGLDLAARWTHPDPATPTFKAMKLYRNYDGRKSTFGDVSVRSAAPNPDNVSAFAAVRSKDGALTVMLINKQLSTSAATTVNLANFAAVGKAEPWQLTAGNVITRLADLSVNGNAVTATLPAQSVTLLVIPAASSTPAPDPTFTSVVTAAPATVVSGTSV